MNAHFPEQRQNLQKAITKAFNKELQTLDAELQSILVDDMITAFFNRYKVLKRNQETQKKDPMKMRRSKLEMHLSIIKTLAQKGPLKLTHVMYKSNVNCSVLKEHMDFLIQQNIVQERVIKKQRIVYELTEKGFSVLRTFREIQELLPFEEEKQRIPAILY